MDEIEIERHMSVVLSWLMGEHLYEAMPLELTNEEQHAWLVNLRERGSYPFLMLIYGMPTWVTKPSDLDGHVKAWSELHSG